MKVLQADFSEASFRCFFGGYRRPRVRPYRAGGRDASGASCEMRRSWGVSCSTCNLALRFRAQPPWLRKILVVCACSIGETSVTARAGETSSETAE